MGLNCISARFVVGRRLKDDLLHDVRAVVYLMFCGGAYESRD